MFKGHIPGFHWDEEKRKYFRIQADKHAAGPASVKYTKENVQKEHEEKKKRKRLAQKQRERRRQLIWRVPNPGVYGELGYQSRSGNLNSRAQILADQLAPNPAITIPSHQGWQNPSISYFAFDKETQGYVYGVSSECSSHESVLSTLPDDATMARPRYSAQNRRGVSVFQSPLSSINLDSRTRTLLTTSTGDRYPPTVHIGQLVESENAALSQPLDTGLSSSFRPGNLITTFCSAINPWREPGNEEFIAVGTSGGTGVILFAADCARERSSDWRQLQACKAYSDILALDWLDANLLVAGMRDSSVMLYDVRVREGVKRMRHSGGVLGIKRADASNRFVAAGMGSQLAMYDLRFLRDSHAASSIGNPPTALKKQKTSGGRRQTQQRRLDVPNQDADAARQAHYMDSQSETASMPIAEPFLTFEYDNPYDLLGLDVFPELGLVAAAETEGYLRISSLLTGKTVKRWDLAGGGGGDGDRSKRKIRCVRFGEDARGVVKIMVGCGDSILELAW